MTEQEKVWRELVKNANSYLNQTFDENSAAILAADAELKRLREAVEWALADKESLPWSLFKAELRRRAKEGK